MAKQPKLIICKHCNQQIASSAKICPHCGAKNKKPFYKKVWFWLLIAIILIAALGNSGSQENGSTDVKPQQSTSANTESAKKQTESFTQTTAPATDIQTVYHVGDTLHENNMDIVYAASGDYTEENQFMQPTEGNKYIFFKFAFINTSDKHDSSISSFSFHCYADGYAVDAYYGGENDISATLSAGRSTMGCVYYQVPADAKEIELEYETNMFTGKTIKFIFGGNQDSGYILEKNTSSTDGALKVGESLEGKTLNIKYLDCYEDSSNNVFITPTDGCHYITCEFEFENVSQSDVAVSSFSFNCFADGVSCNPTFFRDDNISATLSAGRKAKGTVTFEVPAEATVVEVEYLTNYWTSDRIVFDASIS